MREAPAAYIFGREKYPLEAQLDASLELGQRRFHVLQRDVGDRNYPAAHRACKIVDPVVVGARDPTRLKPSDYFRRNLWVVAEPEERTIGAVMDLLGEDRVLWGSDFPHVDSNLEAPHLIRNAIANLSAARQRKLLGENARSVFPA